MLDYIRRLGRDTLVYGVLDVANRFVSVLLVPLYTRVLVPADYGALDLVTTLTTIVFVVLSIGLDSALSYFYNRTQDREERRTVATTILAIGATMAISGVLALTALRGPLVALAMPEVVGASELILLAGLALPFQIVGMVPTMLLRLQFAYKRFAVLSLGSLLATVGVTIYLVLVLRMGVAGILLAQLATKVPFTILGLIFTWDNYAPRIKPVIAREIVRYGAPLVAPNLAYWVVLYFERYALLQFASLEQVGLFGVASRVATFVTLVSNAIDIAWMPFALSIQHDEKAPSVYAQVLTYYVLLTGIGATVISVFAHEMLVLLTQPAYYSAHILVGPIVASLVLRGAINIVAIGAFVKEQTKAIAWASSASVLVQIALLLALIPLIGAFGAALATLAARLFTLAAIARKTRAIYPVPYEWGRLGRMAAVFTLAIAAGVLVTSDSLPVSLALKFAIVIPSTVVLLGAVGAARIDDVRQLTGMLRLRKAAATNVQDAGGGAS
jgi:O-antigen/teichoic acid export membrane protein